MYRSHYIGTDGIGRSCPCNTKVSYFNFTVCRDYDVLWLYISVNDSMIMCCLQPHRYLNGNTCGFFDGELALFGNIFLKSNSLDQFHDNIVNSLIVTYIEYIDNIRMGQACRCLCFTAEFADKCGILSEFRFQYFYCHVAVQLVILCLIDIRHSAGAYLS